MSLHCHVNKNISNFAGMDATNSINLIFNSQSKLFIQDPRRNFNLKHIQPHANTPSVDYANKKFFLRDST